MDRVAVVIPSNRNVDFLENWQQQFEKARIHIVEDHSNRKIKIPDLGLDISHYTWEDIDKDLKNDSWIISKKSDAIRSYGFLKAFQENSKIIVSLDDDCFPMQLNPLIQGHLENLNSAIPNDKWFSTLQGVDFTPRGYPHGSFKKVMLSVGGWMPRPDLDAETQLKFPDAMISSDNLATGPVPSGKFFPMSGMNIAFRREATPMMYFPLMGEGYEFNRYADIWCGIVAKKICDYIGYAVVIGRPLISHKRKSNNETNLELEKSAMLVNEYFWRLIDARHLAAPHTIDDCYCSIACNLRTGTFQKDQHFKYWERLSMAMETWLSLLRE